MRLLIFFLPLKNTSIQCFLDTFLKLSLSSSVYGTTMNVLFLFEDFLWYSFDCCCLTLRNSK